MMLNFQEYGMFYIKEKKKELIFLKCFLEYAIPLNKRTESCAPTILLIFFHNTLENFIIIRYMKIWPDSFPSNKLKYIFSAGEQGCNHSMLWILKQEDRKFEDSLSYL